MTVNAETRESFFDTNIIADAGISSFTEQVLHCINIAMFRSPDDWRPTAIILAHSTMYQILTALHVLI